MLSTPSTIVPARHAPSGRLRMLHCMNLFLARSSTCCGAAISSLSDQYQTQP